MKVRETKLSRELLIALNACEPAIHFCEMNNLFGFPLSRLNEVQGDYNGYVDWLKDRLDVNVDVECDPVFNVTPEQEECVVSWKLANGTALEEWYYDTRGNMYMHTVHGRIVESHEFDHYDNGQLKSADNLIIPQF